MTDDLQRANDVTDTLIPTADGAVSKTHNRPMVPVLTKMELLEDHGEYVTRKADLLERAKKIDENVANWTADDDETITALGRDVTRYLSDVEATRKALVAPYTEISGAINDTFNKDWRDGMGPTQTLLRRVGGARVDHKAKVEEDRLLALAAANRAAATETLQDAASAETQGQHTRAEIKTEQAMLQEGRADDLQAKAANATHQDLGRSTSAAGTMTGRRDMVWDVDRATVDLDALRHFIAADAIDKAIKAFNGINGNKIAANKRDLEIKTPIKGVTFRAVTAGSFR